MAASKPSPAPRPKPEHSLSVVVFRLLRGKHWHGQPLSDATFWSPGTQGPPHWWGRGRPSRWALMAGWQRAAFWWTLLAVLVGLWRWRTGTEWVLAGVGGPAFGVLVWRAWRAVRRAAHRRRLERPLAGALAPYLGTSPAVVESGLNVRHDYEDAASGEYVASVVLPDHWAATPDQRRLVEDVVSARFGAELRYQWRTSAYPMRLNVTRAPVPPARVAFADVREAIDASPADRLVLGKSADGSLVCWDRSAEDPHAAVHGGSRRGKTSLLLLLAAQELRHGGRVVAIDPKRVGLLPLAGMGPAVELHNDPRNVEGQWQAIARFRQLVEDRYDQLEADPTAEFPHALLIIDEVSQFSAQSAAAWRQVKERSDPALPPVWSDVAAVLWMGAQAHCHVVLAGQRLDYNLLGGLLGSFGIRMLAGFQPVDYARLVGVPPVQRSQKARGRFLVYAGGELTWTQLAYGDADELRGWVLEGRQAASQAASHPVPDVGRGPEDATGDSGGRVLVGLAAGAEYLGLSVDAFRKRLERGGRVPGEFRAGGQPAWRAADLDVWAGRAEEVRS